MVGIAGVRSVLNDIIITLPPPGLSHGSARTAGAGAESRSHRDRRAGVAGRRSEPMEGLVRLAVSISLSLRGQVHGTAISPSFGIFGA